MSVYVDPERVWGNETAPPCFRFKPSCHMYADTLPELHEMARRIGLKLSWFQNKPDLPHYDLTAPKRIMAVRNGAVQVDFQHLVEYIKRHRERKDRIKERQRSKARTNDRHNDTAANDARPKDSNGHAV
jgi:hypothetical protein